MVIEYLRPSDDKILSIFFNLSVICSRAQIFSCIIILFCDYDSQGSRKKLLNKIS